MTTTDNYCLAIGYKWCRVSILVYDCTLVVIIESFDLRTIAFIIQEVLNGGVARFCTSTTLLTGLVLLTMTIFSQNSVETQLGMSPTRKTLVVQTGESALLCVSFSARAVGIGGVPSRHFWRLFSTVGVKAQFLLCAIQEH